MTDPRYFPKSAILEQIDTQQLGKSITFCIHPYDDTPFGKIGDVNSVFGTRDHAVKLSHDLCRNLRHKIGNCRGSAFKCDEERLNTYSAANVKDVGDVRSWRQTSN